LSEIQVALYYNMAVFKAIHFSGKQYSLDEVNEFCISQGSATTFFRYGGQMRYRLCQIYSEFRIPKIIKISSFLTELFNK